MWTTFFIPNIMFPFQNLSNHITHHAALTPVNLSDYTQLSLASQNA